MGGDTERLHPILGRFPPHIRRIPPLFEVAGCHPCRKIWARAESHVVSAPHIVYVRFEPGLAQSFGLLPNDGKPEVIDSSVGLVPRNAHIGIHEWQEPDFPRMTGKPEVIPINSTAPLLPACRPAAQ